MLLRGKYKFLLLSHKKSHALVFPILIVLFSLLYVFAISCDTTEPPSPQPITPIPMDMYPDWSPTGEWIAYEHHSVVIEEDTTGIYIIHPDGTDNHLVIPGGYHPSWSPDGKKIAFSASTYDHQIWIYDLESKAYRRLTNEGLNVEPDWNTEGSKIAYRSDQKITIADTSGNILIRTNLGGSFPSWSPNDDSICYNNNGILAIIDITDLEVEGFFTVNAPRWHPFSDEIIYDFYDYDRKENKMGIFNLKTGNNQILSVQGGGPSWSSDGNQIVHTYNIGNKAVLFIINKDGTNNIQLTN